MHPFRITLLAASLLAACASPGPSSGLQPETRSGQSSGGATPVGNGGEGGVATAEASVALPGTGAQEPQPQAVQEPVAGTASDQPAEGPWLSQKDLALLRDPAFKQRFLDSYLSLTEIEPELDKKERKVMLEVLELVGGSDSEAASEEGDGESTEEETEEEKSAAEAAQAARTAEAIELLEDATGPDASAVFDFTLGNLALQAEDFEAARKHYADAVAKKANFRRAWGNLAVCYFQTEQHQAAIRAYAKVIALGGGDATTYGLMGVCANKVNDPIAAESAFRMAALLDPDNKDWKLGIAESFYGQRRYTDAVALFDLLLAQDPNNLDFWMAQGRALAQTGETLRAAQNFELVDRLGGSSADSLFILADIYNKEGLYGPAVTAYVRAMEKDPERKPDRAILAARYMTGSQALDEASALLNGVERVYGDNLEGSLKKDILRAKAKVAVAQGDSAAEAATLEEVLSIDPLDGDALILLGQYYGRNDEPDKAALYFERAAAISGFEADALVRHAQMLVRNGEFKKAVPLLKQAQTIKPRDAIQDYLEQVERRAR